MQRGSESPDPHRVPVALLELAASLALVLVLGAMAVTLAGVPFALIPAAALVQLLIATLIAWQWHSLRVSLGPANRITLIRAVLVAIVAGGIALPPHALATQALALALLSATALLLDGADGWVARRTGSASAFGARFDMELDAFFILVLCVLMVQLDKAGPWVLAIGAMRYVFVLAMRFLPWLAATLPDSFRRKLVCVVQVAGLLVCLLPVLAPPLTTSILALTLAALTLSFAQDVRWLFVHAAGQSVRPNRTGGVRT